MWNAKNLGKIDFRILPIIFLLMIASLLVISSRPSDIPAHYSTISSTPSLWTQIQSFGIGFLFFLFFAGFDYHKLREWTWILYVITIFLLIGVFFSQTVNGVHRWYRIPLINLSFQPSQYAILVVVLALSWLLEKRKDQNQKISSAFMCMILALLPFVLILKQPDLGTAFVILPISLILFYFGRMNAVLIQSASFLTAFVGMVIILIFLNVIPFESIKPIATKVLKEYQLERLNPNTHHQNAASTAIAIGGIIGKGWNNNDFSGNGWLPAPYTDSVFSTLGEQFGLIGLTCLLLIYYTLIYLCFSVIPYAKDHFGKLLAAGIACYITMHVIMNIGMMCGFLPITGVPLLLTTYGGSSVLSTMIALGISQSIYSRRFTFN